MASQASPASDVYRATPRFGLAALLGLMTVFAILFASLRHLDAPNVLYPFFGTLGFATGLAQMRWGGMPRMASVGAGATLLPLWIVGFAIWWAPRRWNSYVFEFTCSLAFAVLIGGFLGYLTGAVVAGVFLLADKLEQSTRSKASA